MLATALERVLLARAASGRDIEVRGTPHPHDRKPARPARRRRRAASRAALAAATMTTTPRRTPGSLRPAHAASRSARPSWKSASISAVVPGLCTGAFWNELFDIIRNHGGSVATLMRERSRREVAFEHEQDRNPTQGWNWWDQTREILRQALGFFVGEQPVDPFSPSAAPGVPGAALATGPP